MSKRLTKGWVRPVLGFQAQPGVTVMYDLRLVAYSRTLSGLMVLAMAGVARARLERATSARVIFLIMFFIDNY